MAVTPTIQNVQPTVGASADTWGGTLNDRLQEAYADITALAVQGNANETAATTALPKTGGDMSGELKLADIAPTSPLSSGFRGLPVVAISIDRVLTGADAGKMVRIDNAVSRAITIPTAASVPFPRGTVVAVRNYMTAGATITITPAVGVTLTVAGSLAPSSSVVVSPGGFVTIVNEDTNIWFVSGTGIA